MATDVSVDIADAAIADDAIHNIAIAPNDLAIGRISVLPAQPIGNASIGATLTIYGGPVLRVSL